MKFLRYSISLTSCFTSNYFNHHSTFSEENNTFYFYIITSKTNTPQKNQEHFFILCFVKNSKIQIGVIPKI